MGAARKKGHELDIERETLAVLDAALGLKGRSRDFSAATPLLGAVPELDSMAVAAVLAGLEDHFGIRVEDDEVDGAMFSTIGALQDFVRRKLKG